MKTAFDDVDDFNKKGGLKAMGESSAGPLFKKQQPTSGPRWIYDMA